MKHRLRDASCAFLKPIWDPRQSQTNTLLSSSIVFFPPWGPVNIPRWEVFTHETDIKAQNVHGFPRRQPPDFSLRTCVRKRSSDELISSSMSPLPLQFWLGWNRFRFQRTKLIKLVQAFVMKPAHIWLHFSAHCCYFFSLCLQFLPRSCLQVQCDVC